MLASLRVVLFRDPLAVLIFLLGREQRRLVDFLEVVFECDVENDMLLPPGRKPLGPGYSGYVVIDRRLSAVGP